ncbi:MAG: lysine--tRNA ligase [Candidatus Heimdallarchaeum aukensis]|uniref:Lysine--tRNA ligase n=1 Tax=Candidatus Heimdallarchaeum aukensis TaxID=2876573 RepID=A0A9Y1BLK3_9ARCH|nr:MAG: lysine--tRNA ligase [Candidatus Heimdallarchaeum aukensis]
MNNPYEIEEREYKHWATVVSEQAIQLFGNDQVVATGWAPSGYYHIGNFKEAVTCRAIYNELKNLGAKTRFILNIDDVDPFDKVPSFFKKDYGKELHKYIGFPINQVPDPLGCHKSYAEHFIANALSIMESFDVNPENLSTAELYKKGEYDKYAKLFLEKKEQVYELTEQITGSRMEDFMLIQCPKCGNLAAPKMTDFSIEKEKIFVDIECRKEKRGCGEKSSIQLGETTWKLKWRLDWASRQDFLGVTVESSGKDHGVAGGSIDTSLAVHKDIFQKEKLPLLIQHGFLTFGGKKLSGSSGSGMPVTEFPKILDPTVFLYKIYRQNLRTDFDFNVSIDVPKVAAEFDQAEKLYFSKETIEKDKAAKKIIKAYELSLIGEPISEPVIRIDYGHLSTIMQVCLFDQDLTLQKLYETNYIPRKLTEYEYELFKKRFERAKYWLENYADERIRFKILDKPECSQVQKCTAEIISSLSKAIESLTEDLHGDNITQFLYEQAKMNKIKPKDFFKALYLVILGRTSGPRAGTLIEAIGKEKVISMMKEALSCF